MCVICSGSASRARSFCRLTSTKHIDDAVLTPRMVWTCRRWVFKKWSAVTTLVLDTECVSVSLPCPALSVRLDEQVSSAASQQPGPPVEHDERDRIAGQWSGGETHSATRFGVFHLEVCERHIPVKYSLKQNTLSCHVSDSCGAERGCGRLGSVSAASFQLPALLSQTKTTQDFPIVPLNKQPRLVLVLLTQTF